MKILIAGAEIRGKYFFDEKTSITNIYYKIKSMYQEQR